MKRTTVVGSLLALLMSVPAAAQDDLRTVASQEFLIYLRSPSMCKGEEAERAAQIAIGRWHEWKFATDRSQEPPAKAFADAGQAFAHLYNELRCRDGLMMYRYGNLLRLNESFESAIRIMEASIPGIREHYPGGEKTVESSLGQACVSAGRHDDAIAHYRRVLQLDPQDAGNRFNLANQLFHKGDLVGAREQGVRSPDGPKVTLSPHPNRESLDAAIAPPTALLFRNRLKGTDKLTRRPGLALLDRDLSALYVDASAHSERVLRSKDARRSHISEQK